MFAYYDMQTYLQDSKLKFKKVVKRFFIICSIKTNY